MQPPRGLIMLYPDEANDECSSFPGAGNCPVSNKLLVVGGSDEDRSLLDSAECFDMEVQRWSYLPSMATKRDGCAAAVGRQQAARSGRTGRRPEHSGLSGVFRYGDADVSYVPSMATERDGCAAAVVGNKLLVVGGRDVEQHTLASAECFDMEAQTWSSLPGMATKRVGCA